MKIGSWCYCPSTKAEILNFEFFTEKCNNSCQEPFFVDVEGFCKNPCEDTNYTIFTSNETCVDSCDAPSILKFPGYCNLKRESYSISSNENSTTTRPFQEEPIAKLNYTLQLIILIIFGVLILLKFTLGFKVVSYFKYLEIARENYLFGNSTKSGKKKSKRI